MFGFGKKKIKVDKSGDSYWFKDVVNESQHLARISKVNSVKKYLLGKHKILNRPNTEFKEEVFVPTKTVFNTIKKVVGDHTSYLIGIPISLNGKNENVVSLFNSVLKKGNYDKVDLEIVKDLYNYGNSFEFVYRDEVNNIIKSHRIKNEDAYPVYDDENNYIAFVEYWKNTLYNEEHYTVYYPEYIDRYKNNEFIERRINNTHCLPIHYRNLEDSEYDCFGEAFITDLIVIMDEIEALISDMNDGVTVHSLKPLAIAIGKRIESRIPKDMVGTILNLTDEGADFKYATALLDHASAKLLLDTLWAQFFAMACVPSAVSGQGNIANVSETSLRLLYASMDSKTKEVSLAVREGIFKRFGCIRKLLELSNKTMSDEDFDDVDFNFNVNRPVDTYSLMEELAIQRSMNAISIQTIIDRSPYSVDTVAEIQRLQEESNSNIVVLLGEEAQSINSTLNNVGTRKLNRQNQVVNV